MLAQDEPPVPKAVLDLVYGKPYQSYGTPAWAKWVEELRNRPGITQDLIRLYHWDYEQKGDVESLGCTMFALEQRRDIPTEELTKFTELLQALHKKPEQNRDGFDLNILCGAKVLANYPSGEHERLLLNLLEDSDDLVKANAARTLGQLGSNDALSKLNELAQRLPHPSGVDNILYDEVVAARNKIVERNGQGTSEHHAAAAGELNAPLVQPKASATSLPVKPANPPENGPWLVWLLVVFAATVGAVWVFLRKAK